MSAAERLTLAASAAAAWLTLALVAALAVALV